MLFNSFPLSLTLRTYKLECFVPGNAFQLRQEPNWVEHLSDGPLWQVPGFTQKMWLDLTATKDKQASLFCQNVGNEES
jgi:hypothetical protein